MKNLLLVFFLLFFASISSATQTGTGEVISEGVTQGNWLTNKLSASIYYLHIVNDNVSYCQSIYSI